MNDRDKLAELPPLLLPTPKRLTLTGGHVSLPEASTGINAHVERITGQRPQGYTLEIDVDAATDTPRCLITASDAAGVQYAYVTLNQLLKQYPNRMPCLRIEDWPAFATRGVMLDVSRSRIPTWMALREMLSRFGSHKFNHVQLYVEHTFAYEGAEEIWRDWSPITPADIKKLLWSANTNGIEIAANQNCFGHLAHWLKHPNYAHLAETHGDWMFDVWPRSGPFSLCPTDPRSIEFVRGLLDQLLPHFTSPLVNIGCDETYDIAYGRSKDVVAQRGRAAVYLDFVKQICEIVRSQSTSLGKPRQPMFWADIALSHPECIPELPQDLIPLAWGYEPDAPFDRWGELFSATGHDMWVCPGTSSWCSLTGRTTESRQNMLAASQAGLKHESSGFLITDWGDLGHWQQWPVTWNALAHAAQAAWSGQPWDSGASGGHTTLADPRAVSLHALNDPSLRQGAWLDDLGDVDLELREVCLGLSRPGQTGRLRNQSALFADLRQPLDANLDVGPIDLWRIARQRLVDLQSRKSEGDLETRDAHLTHTLEFALAAVDRAIARRTGQLADSTQRNALRARFERIRDEHKRLWLLSCREGGLAQSCAFFDPILNGLR